jgi:hypothetical protein
LNPVHGVFSVVTVREMAVGSLVINMVRYNCVQYFR